MTVTSSQTTQNSTFTTDPCTDPRSTNDFPPHLKFPQDSARWTALLTLAFKENTLLGWALWTFRLQGARIVPTPNRKTLRLVPVIDQTGGEVPDQGWESEEAWRRYAVKYLEPYRERLKGLLRAVWDEGK